MRLNGNLNYSADSFFQHDYWLYNLRAGDYQLVSVVLNLGLIMIALALGWVFSVYFRRTGFRTATQKIIALFIFFFWLIFEPNTLYVISEIRHLLNFCPLDSPFKICAKGVWVIMFFFSYAAAGWWSYWYLLKRMAGTISDALRLRSPLPFAIFAIPVISLGYLVGLLDRWNTWELFLFPSDFFRTVSYYFTTAVGALNLLLATAFGYWFYFLGERVFKYGKDND